VISVKGKPFDCGQQYGTLARELIRRNVDTYFDMWHTLWGIGRPEILKQCRNLVPIIGEYDAGILEELEGVAMGADLSLEEIVAVNARYEINLARGLVSSARNGGCTSVATLPQVTKDGHTLLGQNWDWLPRFQGFNVILEVAQTGRPNLITQPEAGNLAHRGMNSAGVGACFNGMASSQDRFESKAPPHLIMMRGILNAENFSQALRAVLDTKPTVSGNFFIAHQDGEAIDLEVSPVDIGLLYPEGGILTHSNHFLTLTNREDLTDIIKSMYPDTVYRCHRARQLLEPDKDNIDVNSFQRVLRDHFSYPQSICRHPDDRAEGIQQWATLFSMIMDLGERTIYISEGAPCQNDYYQLTPESLRKG
jgi:isopenicillin-N N-acyltransferase-like protein